MKIYETPTGIRVLLCLYNRLDIYGQTIAYELRITYSYLSNLLAEFEKMGLITKTKSGRTNKISLTRKGQEVAKKIIEINNLMGKK